MRQFFYNVLLVVSQFLNTLLLGDPDESLSGRCGRAVLSGNPKPWVIPLSRVIDFIFERFFDEPFHVIRSVEWDDPPAKELWRWYGDPRT